MFTNNREAIMSMCGCTSKNSVNRRNGSSTILYMQR